MKTRPHVLAAVRAGLAAHADCDYRLDHDNQVAHFVCEVSVTYFGMDSIADIKREHLARALAADLIDPATLADDDERVTAAAAAIYNGGDEEEWLATVDGSPNAASYHYARAALGSLHPDREA